MRFGTKPIYHKNVSSACLKSHTGVRCLLRLWGEHPIVLRVQTHYKLSSETVTMIRPCMKMHDKLLNFIGNIIFPRPLPADKNTVFVSLGGTEQTNQEVSDEPAVPILQSPLPLTEHHYHAFHRPAGT